jgi:hypothetical protein
MRFGVFGQYKKKWRIVEILKSNREKEEDLVAAGILGEFL